MAANDSLRRSGTADAACVPCASDVFSSETIDDKVVKTLVKAGQFSRDGLSCTDCTACEEGSEGICYAYADRVCLKVAEDEPYIVTAGLAGSFKPPQRANLFASLQEMYKEDGAITDITIKATSTVGVGVKICPSAEMKAILAASYHKQIKAAGAHESTSVAPGDCIDANERRRQLAQKTITFVVTSEGDNADVSDAIAGADVGASFKAAIVAAAADAGLDATHLEGLDEMEVEATATYETTITYTIAVAAAEDALAVKTDMADSAAAAAVMTQVLSDAGVDVTDIQVQVEGAVASHKGEALDSSELDWLAVGRYRSIPDEAESAPPPVAAIAVGCCVVALLVLLAYCLRRRLQDRTYATAEVEAVKSTGGDGGP